MSTLVSHNDATSGDLPLVSVIIPTYNRCEYVCEAIDSALAQTYPNVEIIVVDDGSTDGTADIAAAVRDPRVRVIRQANAGKAAALNTDIAHACHELVVMMDGDTVFEPRHRPPAGPALRRPAGWAPSPATPRSSTGAG